MPFLFELTLDTDAQLYYTFLMKKVHKVKVASLLPNDKYPGRYMASMSIDDAEYKTVWMSEKQAVKLGRRIHEPVLYAAFDYSGEQAQKYGPRYICASTDPNWLADFCKQPDQPYTPAVKTQTKPAFTQPAPQMGTLFNEEDIPF